MATIKVFYGTACTFVEVTDEFATAYAEMERYERLTERKETRRHQSLDKSLEHGFDIADLQFDTALLVEQNELRKKLSEALFKLTERQRFVLLSHILDEQPFRVIGERLGLGTYTVRDYYYNAIKKIKKFLADIPQNHRSRGF